MLEGKKESLKVLSDQEEKGTLPGGEARVWGSQRFAAMVFGGKKKKKKLQGNGSGPNRPLKQGNGPVFFQREARGSVEQK